MARVARMGPGQIQEGLGDWASPGGVDRDLGLSPGRPVGLDRDWGLSPGLVGGTGDSSPNPCVEWD